MGEELGHTDMDRQRYTPVEEGIEGDSFLAPNKLTSKPITAGHNRQKK